VSMHSKTDALQVAEPCGLSFSQLCKLTDEGVMAHVRAGHGDALAVIFDRYHRIVYNVARKILRNAAEAEDVSQTVFLEIFRDTVHFDPSKGSIRSWLLQYAYHRSFNRQRYLNVRAFEQGGEVAAAESREASDAYRNGITCLNLMERTVSVREAMAHLTEAQRRTLKLAFFEGLSIEEICQRTGESPGNVRHHYYRGLKRMKGVLRGTLEPGTLVVTAKGAANADA